jgi:hypothetical protein
MATAAAPDLQPATPVVQPLDPATIPFGHSYADWGAMWWQWIYGQPGSTNPLLDVTGADCAQGQDAASPVWMLVGDNGAGQIERSCTVPPGKALFFPLMNIAVDNAGVPPAMQLTESQLRQTAHDLLASVIVPELSASLDGAPFNNLGRYITGPTRFTYDVPAGDNYYSAIGQPGVDGKVDPSFAAGYWLLLPPLPTGKHDLVFGGHAKPQGNDLKFTVTYHLEIK